MLNLQGSTGMKEIVALLKQKAQEAEGVVAAKEKAERRAATATHRLLLSQARTLTRYRIHSGRLGRQYDRSLSRSSDCEDGMLGWFSTPTAFGTQYTAHYKSSIPEKPEKELPISVVAFASTASDGFAIFYVTHLVYLGKVKLAITWSSLSRMDPFTLFTGFDN
ncbi:hypothetical protein NP233_g10449 [Leucocoprinus birnbaumii]|uniref:Uncharacterized protein n=1 Tax=Leucocoprinus birnbaumii TaxID=56174 RepID=A0AAD5YLA7_9AGAR|nr:hypothetical protein NP233_g10449 [Leucocoprinus birnbaumii]